MTPNEEKLWYLKNLDLLEGIPEEEIMQIASSVSECSFEKDEMIYGPQDTLDSIYTVKRGEVRLFHSNNGKRVVFDVLGAGSIFGGVNLSSEKSTHFAQATHPTKVCIFSEADFKKLIVSKPEIMLRFMKKITGRLREYEDRLNERTKPAETIILSELKNLQEKRRRTLFGKFKANKIHITHEELAELTGLNRVTVTRGLKKLKENGKIASASSGIELV